MRRFTLHIVAAVLVCGVPLAEHALAGGAITFRKIADTNTPIPDGTGNFTALDVAPSIRSGNVVFLGEGSSDQMGIYINVGGTLTLIADTGTAIPDGTGNFTSFGTASIDGQDLAFQGSGVDQSGIYARVGGSVVTVADLSTSIPGGSGAFTGFGTYPPSMDYGDVVFSATGSSSQSGVYAEFGGTLGVIVDTGTAMPETGGNFSSFDCVSLDAGDISFRGFSSSQFGIFTYIGEVLEVVANLNTPIPGGTGNFSTFGTGSIQGGHVGFRAGPSSPQINIYSNIGGKLDVVADTSTPIPNGTGDFALEGSVAPSIEGEYVAFGGTGSGNESGIYALMEGTLIRVVDRNDTLDGKTPSNWGFQAGPEALSGTEVVFFVTFTDDSEGIYVATIPLDTCGNGIVEGSEACDDGNDNDEDRCFSTCRWTIPAVSEWGLLILAMLVLLGGTILLRRRRTAAS